MIWSGLLATILVLFSPLVSAFALQIETPSPRPTCTECDLVATRASGLRTAWAMQSDLSPSQAGDAVIVRAIYFWMDTCGHCHYVLEEVLPPIQEIYGENFEILLVELQSVEDVERLYQTAQALGIPQENVAVPFLIIGDQVLVGSKQIPEQLPGLIEEYLAAGGVDYPDLAPLADIIPEESPTSDDPCKPETPCATEGAQPAEASTPVPITPIQEGIPPGGLTGSSQLSNGFTLAIIVLAGMVAALVYSGFIFLRSQPKGSGNIGNRWQEFAIPVLALIGMGIAGYLAYIETQAVQAFCGPVGDCNAVQSSPYAKLFGILPIGVLGVAGYVGILAAWIAGRVKGGRFKENASLAISGMALFGTLFSIYLTYLEPFVIRAVCIWCLSSAVIITLLLVLSVKPGLHLSNKWSPAKKGIPNR
jgi:uncharacterized membrane protein